MKCKLCKWLCDWLCGPELSSGAFWDMSKTWEQNHSNEWELWSADDEDVRALNERANQLFATDPVQTFLIRKELADNGSAWAMRCTGLHYQTGRGVEPNLAQAEHYIYQAQLAGSWMATLDLAKLLFDHRINEKWWVSWRTVSSRTLSRPIFGWPGISTKDVHEDGLLAKSDR